jgi:hypothetical protein
MRKVNLTLIIPIIIIGITTCKSFVYSQVQRPVVVYDSTGIAVNISKDLNDTLTHLPGTKARIRLPRYFEPFAYENFIGFIHKGTSTTITAFEYPGMAYTAYTSRISDSLFAAQGVELLEVLDMKQNDGRSAKAFIVRFKTKTATAIRIMYFTGDYQTMYYLVANVPESVSNMIRNALLVSFQTLEY